MFADFAIGDCLFGGSANRIFGNAILRFAVLLVRRFDDFAVGVFAVVDFNRADRGVGAGAVSVESNPGFERFDDGAANSVYFAVGRGVRGAGYRVGDCDVADYSVRFVHQTI